MYRAEKQAREFSKMIKDQDLYPICIPSYNRPNAVAIRKLYEDTTGLNVILFVRKEEYKEYEKYSDKFKIVRLNNVSNIGETRAAIVRYCWAKGIDNIFMFDDDIHLLDFIEPSLTKNGKPSMRCHSTCIGKPYKINKYALKLWQGLIENVLEPVAMSAPGGRSDYWDTRYKDSPYVYNQGYCIRCIHLNTGMLKEHHLNYQSNDIAGVEDYALQYKILEEGLRSIVIKDLAYDCKSVGKGMGGNQYDSDLNKEFSDRNKLFIENILGGALTEKVTLRTTKSGFQSLRFNWKYWREEA